MMRASRALACPFGRVLVTAREERGLTQGQLARRLEWSPQQLSRMECGEREPMLSTLLLLAAALDMDPGDLVRRAAGVMTLPAPGQDNGRSEDA